MTTEELMVCAIKAGISLSDFEFLDIGMVLDYIDSYIELSKDATEREDKVVMATQEDFNHF